MRCRILRESRSCLKSTELKFEFGHAKLKASLKVLLEGLGQEFQEVLCALLNARSKKSSLQLSLAHWKLPSNRDY